MLLLLNILSVSCLAFGLANGFMMIIASLMGSDKKWHLLDIFYPLTLLGLGLAVFFKSIGYILFH